MRRFYATRMIVNTNTIEPYRRVTLKVKLSEQRNQETDTQQDMDDSEEQGCIFEGAMLRCNQWMRKHLLKKLSTVDSIRRENQRHNKIINSRKMISRIQEFINITEEDEDSDQDTILNAQAMIEDKIIYLSEKMRRPQGCSRMRVNAPSKYF